MKVNHNPTTNLQNEKPAFKAINQEYLNKVKNFAKKSGDAPAEAFFDISRDVFDKKMSIKDGLDTIDAIKPYVKTDGIKDILIQAKKQLCLAKMAESFSKHS